MLFFLLPLYLTNKPSAQTGKAAAAYIAVRSCVSVTAAKTSEALRAWNTNALVRAGILKHYKR